MEEKQAAPSSALYNILRMAALGLGIGGTAAAGYGAYKMFEDASRAEKRRKGQYKRLEADEPSFIDVAVSPAEAARLRGQGFKVAEAQTKEAFMPGAASFGAGLAGTLAAYGGWKGVSALMNKFRKGQQKKRNQLLRDRINALLEERPYEEDAKLAAYMGAARDKILPALEKDASIMSILLGGLGAGSALAAIAAAKSTSDVSDRRVKAVRDWLDRQPVPTRERRLQLRPVLAADAVEAEDAEEKRRRQLMASE